MGMGDDQERLTVYWALKRETSGTIKQMDHDVCSNKDIRKTDRKTESKELTLLGNVERLWGREDLSQAKTDGQYFNYQQLRNRLSRSK